jgi:hypothetical protein
MVHIERYLHLSTHALADMEVDGKSKLDTGLSLMRVSRLTRQEVGVRLYEHHNFVFKAKDDLDFFRRNMTPATKQLISSITYTIDTHPGYNLSRSLVTVLEAFPNLTQLGLRQCSRSTTLTYPFDVWQPKSVAAFELIQKRRPQLSTAYCYDHWGPSGSVRFVDEVNPRHPVREGSLKAMSTGYKVYQGYSQDL